MNVGESRTFAYTGGMQSFTVDTKGIYKLEVWGAGGDRTKGGYSSGYKELDVGTTVYVCVGQMSNENAWGNRYNGGRDQSSGSNPAHWYGCTPGAGCTHMATASGELASLSGNRGAVLIVAGGGAGDKGSGVGGNGGGTSGGSSASAAGGTQTSGAGFGYGGYADVNRGGGGAGWYGGYASSGDHGGGGGSGYIGGVPSFSRNGVTYAPSTTTGGGSASGVNGTAKITFIAKSELPVTFNGTKLEKIMFNGVEVKSLIVNGVKLFMERLKRRMLDAVC